MNQRFSYSSPLQRLVTVAVVIALVAGSCTGTGDDQGDPEDPTGSDGQTQSSSDDPATASSSVTVQIENDPNADPETEILIELADSTPSDNGTAAPRETTLDGSPLDPADSALLLGRLPELEAEPGDPVDFSRPPETRPRPRAGETVDQNFPFDGNPAEPGETTDPGPLEVLRFQPQGPVDLAPFISVTFNQPMIELGTVTQVEAAQVPITVTPDMPGRWLWLGTRTVRFEYEPGAIDRIPAATNYVVEVDPSAMSVTGSELGSQVRFEFSTPAPTVTTLSPIHESLATEPIFFIEFDQRVDPAAILEVTALSADRTSVPIRLANDEEVAEDAAISRLTERALPERWVAIRPVDPLPNDAALALQVGPDTPSAEGPVTNPETHIENGRTYGPLRVAGTNCGWSDDSCTPGQQFRIEFSNPIDAQAFSADQVQVSPAIAGMRIGVSHNAITIQGRTKGNTTYEISLDATITDTFGQQLGDDATESITVGDAPPALFSPGRQLVTLDPIVDDDNLNVTSINNDALDVQIYQVDPIADWSSYIENGWRLAHNDWTPNWSRVDERRVDTDGEDNEFTETAINMSDELDATGHVVVLVAPQRRGDDEWQNQPFVVWVQRTSLGLDAYTDNQSAVAWVTDLRSGEPIAGAEVGQIRGSTATTDADGVAELELGRDVRGLYVKSDGETALIGDFWANAFNETDEVRWHVLDDRGLYKPGETVRVKGWARRADQHSPAELSLPDGGTVEWRSQDDFGNQIGQGQASLSAAGGFDFELELRADITLGHASIQLSTNAFSGVDHQGYWHSIQVQEFRRPDFEVSADIVEADPHFAGDALTVDATATYFAGGAIGGSPVEWLVSANTTSYSPPTWPDYNFGIWQPWWLQFEFDGFPEGGFGATGASEHWSGTTDPAGNHGLSMTVSTDGKPRPLMVSATATVTDVNRQPISGSTNTLIHPAEFYVGMQGTRSFVQAGESFSIDLIVTDIDGTLVGDRDVTVTSTRLEWRFEGGSWTEVPVTDDSCTVTSADGPVGCTFTPTEGGRYRIAATVTDAAGRSNLSEITRWVSGGTRPQSRRVDLEQLTLVPDGDSWQPGETAEILVQSPFGDAHGLAVISRRGIDRTQTFDFDESGSAVLKIPVTESDIPGIGVQVEVVGTAPRAGASAGSDGSTPARPAYAAGQIRLPVPPRARSLHIDVAPRQARLEPGQGTQVDVAITDHVGDPVQGAEMVVIVVDEAVLSLTGYQPGDPLDSFYPSTGGSVQAWRGRATLLLGDPAVDGFDRDTATAGDSAEDSAMAGADGARLQSAEMAMDDAAAAPTQMMTAESGVQPANANQPAITLRTDFDALAVFEPSVTTDADGRATIDVPLPDNLTRYRVMVVATADATHAGNGESNITARLPITVRATPPRFANFGDQFEFPVVVQNATDDDLNVDVAFRSTNLNVQDRDGTTVRVPANDRIEVRFHVAADEAGTARYQIAAAAGDFADAAEGSFPVYTPATAEAFATYGVVDDGSVAQPFATPQDVFAQFGGLEISTSSTAVAALTDAVIYLHEYRFNSSDALASRITAIVALDDILTAFESERLPTPAELRATANGDIDGLVSMQNNDGGFPSWRRGRESIPYNSVQATHALVLAADDGFVVPDQPLANALAYLGQIEDSMPPWYSERTRRAISAYAVHVRFLAGDSDVNKATELYTEAGGEQVDVAAWLWPVLADTRLDAEIATLLNNRVTETANAATFAVDYEEQAWVLLHSDRRTDAVVLNALLRMRPESDLVLKTLNGLLAARSDRGHWSNIQENSFVLLAASTYFDRFEDSAPDFVARAWIGATYAVEHTYASRSTDVNATLVPMAFLLGDPGEATGISDTGSNDIVVAKDGDPGRLYYRLGLRYAPTDFELAPRDQGFVVDRRYEAVDDPDDVVQADDQSWSVRAGARVRVRLTMVADSRRTHVALIDPMPAGFEAINPALATSEPVPNADPAESFTTRFWWYRWFDHQNLRDDRAEAFATWLGAGSYEYTYVARATTPGTFVVPPTRAEQMYEPEVFGRSANTTVTITD